MNNSAQKDQGDEHGGIVGSGECSSSPGPARRDYLKSTARVGVSATLAHFVLLGGRNNKVLADSDNCPTFVSSDDNCDPHPNHWDWDECKPAVASPWSPEIGDECGNTSGGQTEPDECQTAPHNEAMGDECSPRPGSPGDVQYP